MTSSPCGNFPFDPVQNLRLFSTVELPLAGEEWNLPDFPQAFATFHTMPQG